MILAQESISKSLGHSKESRNRLRYIGKGDICYRWHAFLVRKMMLGQLVVYLGDHEVRFHLELRSYVQNGKYRRIHV